MTRWDGIVVVTTPRLLLRTFRLDDLPAYAALNADPEVARYLGGPKTRGYSDSIAEWANERYEEEGLGLLAEWRLCGSRRHRLVGMDDLARFFEFERRVGERLSTRTEPYDFGVAYLDEDYPERYYSNVLLADRRLGDATAEALIDAADRILGGAGCAHRQINVHDERQGARLEPGFIDRGFTTSWNVTMVHRRAPDREADLDVEEVPFADASALIHEMYRQDPEVPESLARRFTEQHGRYERLIGARWFAARVDGQLAGSCELYLDGLDAQVENVGTLERFRGRGVARSMVLGAVGAATRAGARHTFIVTDQDDWPKDLYERFGFDRIGRTWQFLRAPG